MCVFFSCLPRRGVDDDDNASSSLVSSMRDQHPVPVVAPSSSAPDPDPSNNLGIDLDLWSRRPRRKVVVGRKSRRIRIGQRRQKSRRHHTGFALAASINTRAKNRAKRSEANNTKGEGKARTGQGKARQGQGY